MVSATFFALAAGPVTGAAITEFARPTIPIVCTFRGFADAEAVGADVAAAVAVAVAVAVAITASAVWLLGQARMEAAWRAGDRVGIGIAMLRLALAIDAGFTGVADKGNTGATVTDFALVAIGTATRIGVATARISGPAAFTVGDTTGPFAVILPVRTVAAGPVAGAVIVTCTGTTVVALARIVLTIRSRRSTILRPDALRPEG